jgi:alkanesulfonate monooxygenase
MADRQLRVGAFMRPVGIHAGWWRYPGAYPMRISTSST